MTKSENAVLSYNFPDSIKFLRPYLAVNFYLVVLVWWGCLASRNSKSTVVTKKEVEYLFRLKTKTLRYKFLKNTLLLAKVQKEILTSVYLLLSHHLH